MSSRQSTATLPVSPGADESSIAGRSHAHFIDRAVSAFVVILTLGRMAYVLLAPIADLLLRSTDDSYYYLNVARNIVLGRGITFDGMNPTNGFHPLWMLMLLPVYQLAGGDPILGFRGAFVLVTILAGLTLWVAYITIRASAGRGAALLGLALLLMPFSLNALHNGLETGLLILLLFVCFWAIPRYRLLSFETSVAADAAFGALLGLVFLARLDAAFLVLAVGVAIIVQYLRMGFARPRAGVLIRKAVVMGATFGLLAIPYFLWNFKTFGHLTPISGALKSSFPRVSVDLERFESFDALYGLGQILICTVCLRWLSRRRDRTVERRDSQWDMLVVFWAGCWLHFVFSLSFTNWAGHWWHYGAYIPLTTILIAKVFRQYEVSAKLSYNATRIIIGATLVLALSGNYADMRLRENDHLPLYQAAMWANEHLPADAVIGMTDCGLFGYFCGRTTINLDGVINGYEYQAALRDGRLAEYLQRCGVTHMADYEVEYRDGRHWIRLLARLHRRAGMAMLLTAENELYRSKPFRHTRAKGETVFAVWPIGSVRIMPIDPVTLQPRPSETTVVKPPQASSSISGGE